jgi:hypothetical protein
VGLSEETRLAFPFSWNKPNIGKNVPVVEVKLKPTSRRQIVQEPDARNGIIVRCSLQELLRSSMASLTEF